jgi:hypothetical protein
MNSIDYTSISASRLLLTLKQQAAQLPASGALQEQTLLLSFQELGAGRPYWPSMDVERKVWKVIKDILTRPVPKISRRSSSTTRIASCNSIGSTSFRSGNGLRGG